MTPRRQSAGVRDQILRAALDEIGKHGVGAVSNRSIAQAAGVSLGSLTYYFKSQDEILRESLELFLSEEVERLQGLASGLAETSLTPDSAATALEAMLRGETRRRLAKLELYVEAGRDPRLRSAAKRCFAAYDELAAAALRALGVPDPEDLAPVMVALIDGLQLRRLASGRRQLELSDPLGRVLGALLTR
jgi:DNA-binding transcriptional regulator YbjK